jgi:hypothetical protein
MTRLYREDLQEIGRLEGVVKNWREKVAGTVPLSKDHKVRRLRGHANQGPEYVLTQEWKVAWLKVVRDEISNRKNSTSTLSLSMASENISCCSNNGEKGLWTRLSVLEKFGAVKDWLKEEIDEEPNQD